MRTSSLFFTVLSVLLFAFQALASPVVEARQNNGTATTSSSSSGTSSSSAATDTASGVPAGVGAGSSGSGEGSSGQNVPSAAGMRYGGPVMVNSVLGAVGFGIMLAI